MARSSCEPGRHRHRLDPRGVVRRPEQPAPARRAAQPGGHRGPDVSGGAGINQELTCSQGAWAPDLLGAFLYRAPRSFAYEWQKDGVGPILGTDANFTPTEAGSYTCRVTATNQAGSDSQTSAPHSVTANPTVNFVRPAEDATEVLPNAVVVVAFDKAMNKSSAQGAFSLERTSDGAPVSGTFGWYGAGVLLFKPSADLAPGTQYTASVSTAAEDLAGNPLAVAKTWGFTTTNRPSISFVRPAAGATDVQPNALVVVAFNKAMDKPSAQAAFSLERTSDGAPVSGTFGWYGPGVLLFKPDADLAAGTQYTAAVSGAAQDLDGNTLTNPLTWSYTTGASG